MNGYIQSNTCFNFSHSLLFVDLLDRSMDSLLWSFTGSHIIITPSSSNFNCKWYYKVLYTKLKLIKNWIYGCNSRPYSNYINKQLLRYLELYAKIHSYLTIFILHMHVFMKNNSRFVISIKNWIYRHVICIFLTKKNFLKKRPRTKNFFELKYFDLYISRCSFWRRLRIWYYFCWKM